MKINRDNLINRFLTYIKEDTTSDPASETFPSTDLQHLFGDFLVQECANIGLSEIKKSEYGIVTASLPSNVGETVPVIGFVAHMDTAPQFSGTNVNPRIVENYDGGEIQLGTKLILSPSEFPHLKNYLGQDLIVTDGTTLLGADNKAGIAEILTAMEYLIAHPEIPHGTIKIAFTPDEEIGRGVDKFDITAFGADFAYTIDGGELGELENESFNAAEAVIEITGKSVHPGAAKDIMVNASNIAADIASFFPKSETPEKTEKYEGFYLLTDIKGGIDHAKMKYIIRDFDKTSFANRKMFIEELVSKTNIIHHGAVTLTIRDQYFNMKEVLDKHPQPMALAKKAMENLGIKPIISPIRGGADGSRLSFMGLPCPNIFTGGHNFHGPFEYIPIDSMVRACEVIVEICEINTEN